MKMFVILFSVLAALVTPASAQEATVTLKLTMPEIQIIYDALSVQPYNKVSGAIESVKAQAVASQRPPTVEPPKAEPPKAEKK